MYKYLIILVFIFLSTTLHAGKENNIWYFGDNCGIDFNSGKAVFIDDGQLNTEEGSAVICDSSGILLFYTDGIRVYTKEHQIMPNGDNLYGHSSSVQSALIVPKPFDPYIYYIFTTDATQHMDSDYGVNYSVVDMRLNNGLGDITQKNINLYYDAFEQLAAVVNADSSGFWVVTHKFGTNEYQAYLVDANGVNMTPVVSSVGIPVSKADGGKLATIKFSVDGTKIAATVYKRKHPSSLEIFNFNNATGKLSEYLLLNDPDLSILYGCEFSPDGSKLYVSHHHTPREMYQYDLSSGIVESVLETRVLLHQPVNMGGQLQLAPDGKIYYTSRRDSYLGVINKPNNIGLSCDFNPTGFWLEGRMTQSGLPSSISSLYNIIEEKHQCDFVFDDFEDIDKLVLMDDAYHRDSTIRLTKSKNWQSSAVKYEDKISLNERFICEFSFEFRDGIDPSGKEADPIGADGIALIFHNSEFEKVGKAGSGIGFESIPNCLAVEYDTYMNDSTQIAHKNDPDGNHIAVFHNRDEGIMNMHGSPSDLGTTSDFPTIYSNGRRYYSKIEHNPNNTELVIYLDTTDNFTNPVLVIPDFKWDKFINTDNGSGFIGITSATGNVSEYHEIFDWSLCYPDRVIAGVEDRFSQNEITEEKYHTVSPNPVKNQTYFKYEVEEAAQVTIEVIDISGKTVAIPVNQFQSAGTYSIPWQPGNLNKGAYYYQLKIGPESYQGRLIIGE